jgi:hypothetical protein
MSVIQTTQPVDLKTLTKNRARLAIFRETDETNDMLLLIGLPSPGSPYQLSTLLFACSIALDPLHSLAKTLHTRTGIYY